jgi:predicted nucleic acid-binding protein
MSRYVLDPPTLVHVVSLGIAIHPEHQLVAPNSLRSEALSLLYDRVRQGELSEAEALQLHERITEVKVRLLGDRVSRRTAWRIAREHGWEALDDAEYLAVTRLQADALVTIDASLARRAQGIVPLASLDALSVSGQAKS